MQFSEIKTVLLDELGLSLNELHYLDNDYEDIVEKLGKYKIIATNALPTLITEAPGDGGACTTIIHFIEHDIYIATRGWYSSWDSSLIDELIEVRPVEKVIVDYQPV